MNKKISLVLCMFLSCPDSNAMKDTGSLKLGSLNLMNLNFCCNIQMVGSQFGTNPTDPICLVSTVLAFGGGLMLLGIFAWPSSDPLIPINQSTPQPNWVLLLTISTPLGQDISLCYKAQVISNWGYQHDVELHWPPQSPDPNPKKALALFRELAPVLVWQMSVVL